MGEQSLTLKQLIEDELLPAALRCDINLFDFWEMTVKEVSSVIDIYTEKKKAEAKAEKIKIYNLALLNAAFVGRALAGKNIPDLDKVFPELAQDVQEQPQAQDDKSWLIIKEKMIDFANAANKHRKK